MAFVKYKNRYIKLRDNFCYLENTLYFKSFSKLTEFLNENDFDKVVIIVRHSMRPSNDWSPNVALTDLGISYAEMAGEQLMGLNGLIDYYATDTRRTKETAYYISQGREDNIIKRLDDVLPMGNIKNPEYVKNQTKYNEYTNTYGYNQVWYRYCYNNEFLDAFKDIAEESNAFVNTPFTYTTKKQNLIISHDQSIIPLVVYLTDKKVNFIGKWLNFISGIAIIEKNSEKIAIPVTGLPSGFKK